jgi:hypothetical protein
LVAVIVGFVNVIECRFAVVMDRTELPDDCDSIVSFSSVASSCSAASGVGHHIFVDIKYYVFAV